MSLRHLLGKRFASQSRQTSLFSRCRSTDIADAEWRGLQGCAFSPGCRRLGLGMLSDGVLAPPAMLVFWLATRFRLGDLIARCSRSNVRGTPDCEDCSGSLFLPRTSLLAV